MRNFISLALFACCLFVGCSNNSDSKPESTPAPSEQESEKPEKKDEASSTEETSVPVDSSEAMAKIEELYKKGDYRSAFPLLNKLHEQKSCPAKGYAIRAQILDHSGLTSQAIASMTVALTKEKDRADWHNMLGLMLVKIKNHALAEQAFSKSVQLDPKFSKAYNNRGLMYIAKREFELAIKDFNEAIRHSSEYIDAFNNRGYAYLEMEKYPKAIENFTKAITLDPKYVKGYNNRGFAYVKMGKPETAVDDFSKAIDLSPYTVKHYLHRRDAWIAMDDQDAAEKDLKQAQWVQALLMLSQKINRSQGKDATLFVDRASHYVLAQQYEKALADIDRALKIEESCIEAHNAKAKLYFSQKNYEQTVQCCTKALEFDDNFEARSLRGDAYLLMGKVDEAISDFEAVQRIDLEVATAFWKRAELRKQQGDTAGEKKDRETALKIDPTIKDRVEIR